MPELPSISLVICTYNRCKYLPAALKSVAEQNCSANLFELIVVDNASTDETATIAQDFIAAHPGLNIRYVYEGNKGLSFARNRGRVEAKSNVVAYIDDDVILFEDYVANLNDFFVRFPEAVGAGGRIIPKYEKEEPIWMSKYLKGFVGEVAHGDTIKKFDKGMKYPAGASMIYTKAILEQAGGFNNELKFRSDDKYIFYKVLEFSDAIYYLPDVRLYHYIDEARLEFGNFKKLFLKTGNEEKLRMRSAGKSVIPKAFEFMFKTGAALVIGVWFTIKGQYSKGKMVFLSQWFTLSGFFKKEVFVR
ncbi:MAG: glycosyltransferase family 2 protein [Chitinophagaceae bacterium]|nr:glycosyltransferase family 2 protein [Chitinophagaceae bacterium]